MFVRKAKYDALEATHEETLAQLAAANAKIARMIAPLRQANEKRRRSAALSRLAENDAPFIGERGVA